MNDAAMTTTAETPAASTEYAMPSLGADMEEGAVVEWLVAVGDHVERGQVVARVETEKSDIDIEIWQEGVVAEIVVPGARMEPEMRCALPITKVTAMVSPSARPRPSMTPPMTPTRVNGNTT